MTQPQAATWTADPAADTYVVRLLDAAGVVVTERIQTSASATFSGLQAGAAHTVVVFAGGPAGFSTGASTAATTAGMLVVATTTTAKGTVQVRWTAPTGSVTSYTVVARDTVSGQLFTKTVTTTSTTFTGLTAGRTYVFTVEARNTAGTSPVATSTAVKVLR